MERWLAVGVLAAVVVLAYVAMWRGWRGREASHDLPPLVPVPPVADRPDVALAADARYFGTTVAGDWLDRVVARGLGLRSRCRLELSPDGLDVARPTASFRIPVDALRRARQDLGLAGKVVPPHGLLVVTWRHGDLTLDSGFRLTDAAVGERGVTGAHDDWIDAISKMTKENAT